MKVVATGIFSVSAKCTSAALASARTTPLPARIIGYRASEMTRIARDEIWHILSHRLPREFRGHSTNFGPPAANGVRLPKAIASGPVDHMPIAAPERLLCRSWKKGNTGPAWCPSTAAGF